MFALPNRPRHAILAMQRMSVLLAKTRKIIRLAMISLIVWLTKSALLNKLQHALPVRLQMDAQLANHNMALFLEELKMVVANVQIIVQNVTRTQNAVHVTLDLR